MRGYSTCLLWGYYGTKIAHVAVLQQVIDQEPCYVAVIEGDLGFHRIWGGS